ncbi:MAG: hypothetical protein HY074_00055 [Deltaproteobacteria bacterium]|nr:hypothetical protein [Deltaproteobacteria bacterium]
MSKLDLTKIATYSLKSRASKVEVKDFARPLDAKAAKALEPFLDSLPGILAASDLRQLIAELKRAKGAGRRIMWGMGSHVIKTGLAPLLIDLMDQGFITSLAFNGSALIHDFETAYAGKTSEDVDAVLGGGQFGMAEETGDLINQAISEGVAKGMGLGEALGAHIAASDYPYKELSLFAQAFKRKLPATVHVAIGTDIIHMHPKCDAAALGLGSHRDFMKFAEEVSQLEGGAYLNLGSAVILPEVFLKSITLVRNLKFKVDKICTANFDFIQQYRERVNVVQRPTTNGGRGFSFTGHHELLLPLLAAGLKA